MSDPGATEYDSIILGNNEKVAIMFATDLR